MNPVQKTRPLPSNVVTHILSYAEMNPIELIKVRSLSISWKTGASADQLWRTFSPTEMSEGKPLIEAFIDRRVQGSVYSDVVIRKIYESPDQARLSELMENKDAKCLQDDCDFFAALASRFTQQRRPEKLDFFPSWLLRDPYIMPALINVNPKYISYAPKSFINSSFVDHLITKDPFVIFHLPSSYQKNATYIAKAISEDIMTYEQLPQELRCNREWAKRYLLSPKKHLSQKRHVPYELYSDTDFWDSDFLYKLSDAQKYTAHRFIQCKLPETSALDRNFIVRCLTFFPEFARKTDDHTIYCNFSSCLLEGLRNRSPLTSGIKLEWLQEALGAAPDEQTAERLKIRIKEETMAKPFKKSRTVAYIQNWH